MRTFIQTLAASLVLMVMAGTSAEVFAQRGAGPSLSRAPRPTISPYMNLLDNTRSTESQYYTQVRPQNEFRQSIYREQQSLSRLQANQQRLQQTLNSGLTATGQAAGFMTHTKYFGVSTGRR